MSTENQAVQQQRQLTPVQSQYLSLSKAENKGFESFVKLFEMAGNSAAVAKSLAEKEAYHLAQLMADNADLQNIPPAALMMEMRKIPLQGVTLDPTLRLAYLIIQDKAKGKVSLEVNGRGMAVQAIAQGIIKTINTECIFEGDKTEYVDKEVVIIPTFKAGSKVIGGICSITWPDGKITQEYFREGHIKSWESRSAKKFYGRANANYTSFNGGIEPGFMQSKMLKHKLNRLGINPLPFAYKRLTAEQLEALPGDADLGPQVIPDATYDDMGDGQQDPPPPPEQPQGEDVPPPPPPEVKKQKQPVKPAEDSFETLDL